MVVGGIVGVRSIVDRVCARPDILEACRKHEPQQHGGELREGRPDWQWQDRGARLQEPRWRGADFSPGQRRAFVAKILAIALDSFRHLGGAPRGGSVRVPSRNDRSGDGSEAGGEGPREPMVDRQLELDLLRQHIAQVTETGKGHAVLILGESVSEDGGSPAGGSAGPAARDDRDLGPVPGRGAEPLLPLKEALPACSASTPDQIRRTLARAAPHLLDAVPFIGTFLASIGEKLAEGSFSLAGCMEGLITSSASGPPPGIRGFIPLLVDRHPCGRPRHAVLPQFPVPASCGRCDWRWPPSAEEQLSDYPELADLDGPSAAHRALTLTVVPLERAHVADICARCQPWATRPRTVHCLQPAIVLLLGSVRVVLFHQPRISTTRRASKKKYGYTTIPKAP